VDGAKYSSFLRGETSSYEAEKRYRRKDGRVIWVRVAVGPLRDAAGTMTAAGVIEDITARKQADEILHRYELLANHSRDIILFLRRDDGRILEANTAATMAHGYSRDELLNMTIYDLRPPESRQQTQERMAYADSEPGGILFQATQRRKDGSSFPVEVSSRGATIDGTRVLVSVMRDITDRKAAEESLAAANLLAEKARAAAEEASRAKDHFLAVLSHELSHPAYRRQPGSGIASTRRSR
jgi:PAS domain S-box-containing protein